MFVDIYVDIFQLYDVCKGKKRALALVPHTKKIRLEKFYVGEGNQITLK